MNRFFSMMLISLFTLHYWGIRVNVTSSMPVGVYIRGVDDSINRGDIVASCVPSKYAQEGKSRGYLNRGSCTSNTEPVVKRVIGIKGDTYLVTKKGVYLNGKFYNAPLHEVDLKQRRLHHEPLNHHPKILNGFWLYGENNPNRSWDSRYFGAVKAENIIGKYRELITLSSHQGGERFSPTFSTPNSQIEKNNKTPETHASAEESLSLLTSPRLFSTT